MVKIANSPDFSFRALLRRATEKEGLHLQAAQIESLDLHFRLLNLWGRRMNLTAIRDPRVVVERHFLEGLIAGRLVLEAGIRGPLLDLGSGNGFPSIPMVVVSPDLRPVLLVESSQKRAAFLRALLRELGWSDSRVEVRHVARDQDLADLPCRLFTSRGVDLSSLLAGGLPFLESGGAVLLFATEVSQEPGWGPRTKTFRMEAKTSLPGRRTGLILLRKV